MQRKMIEADKNLRALFRDMFQQHGGPGARFTVELEQPLRSLLLQIKRDILRTVKEERIVLREFSISEGLPATEIPEVLTRGVDVDSPNWKAKLRNPKFQSSAATVRSASLKTQAQLDKTALELEQKSKECEALRQTIALQEKEVRALKKKVAATAAAAAAANEGSGGGGGGSGGRDYNALLAKHEKALENFKATHAKMAKTVAQYKEHIENLNRQRKERVQTITTLRATKGKQKELLAQQQKMITDFSDQVKAQDRDLNRLRKSLSSAQHSLKAQKSAQNERLATAKLAATTALEKARAAHEETLKAAVAEKEELLAQNFAAHSRSLMQKIEKAQGAATAAEEGRTLAKSELEDAAAKLARESEAAQKHQQLVSTMEDRCARDAQRASGALDKLRGTTNELRAAQDETLKLRYEYENVRHFEAALLQRQAAGEAAVTDAQRDAESSTALHRKALARFEKELRDTEHAAHRREEALSAAFEERLASANHDADVQTATLQQQLSVARSQRADAEERARARMERLESEVAAVRDEAKASEVRQAEEAVASTTIVNRLEATLAQAQREATAAEARHAEAVKQADGQAQMADEWKEMCNSTSAELREAEHEVNLLKASQGKDAGVWAAERAALEQRVTAVQSSRDAVVRESAEQRENLIYTENIAATAQIEIQQLRAEVDNLDERRTRTMAEAEAAQVLASDLAQTRAELEQRHRDVELAKQRHAVLERQQQATDERCRAAELEVANHARTVEALQTAQATNRDARVENAEAEVQRLDAARSVAEATATSLRREVETANAELAAAHQAHTDEVARLHASAKQLQTQAALHRGALQRARDAHRAVDCRTLRELKAGLTGLVQALYRATSTPTGERHPPSAEQQQTTAAVHASIELASDVIADAEQLLIELAATGIATSPTQSPRRSSQRYIAVDSDDSSGDDYGGGGGGGGGVRGAMSASKSTAAVNVRDVDDDNDDNNGEADASVDMSDQTVALCVRRASACLETLAESFRRVVDVAATEAVDARARAAQRAGQLVQLRGDVHSYRGELSDLKAQLKQDVVACRIQAMQAVQTLHRRHDVAAAALRGRVGDTLTDRDAAEATLREFRAKHSALLGTTHELRVELQHASSAVELGEAAGEAKVKMLQKECDDADVALSHQRERFEEILADRAAEFERKLQQARRVAVEEQSEVQANAEKSFEARQEELESQWQAAVRSEHRELESKLQRQALERQQVELSLIHI